MLSLKKLKKYPQQGIFLQEVRPYFYKGDLGRF